jgi:N-methylhydantoinase A
VRYRGQGFELNVPLTGRQFQQVLNAFHNEHQRRYGYSHRDREVEIVTVRLRATLPALVKSTFKAKYMAAQQSNAGRVQIGLGGKKMRAELRERQQLRPNRIYRGPAVVTEYSATTVVLPGMKYRLDRAGNLLIETR